MQTGPIRLQMMRRVQIRRERRQTRSRSKVIHENVKIRHFLRHLSPALKRQQGLACRRYWKSCDVSYYDFSESKGASNAVVIEQSQFTCAKNGRIFGPIAPF